MKKYVIVILSLTAGILLIIAVMNIMSFYNAPDYNAGLCDEENQTVQSEVPETKEFHQFEIKSFLNRKDEAVFSFTAGDFVGMYNDVNPNHLSPISEWRKQIFEKGVHSGYPTVQYTFSEDENVWSLPTLVLYAASDNESVQEVSVTFDWHSYSESLYSVYEDMCLDALNLFFPEKSDEVLKQLCSDVNRSGYDNMFPVEKWYMYGSLPYEIWHKGDIGVYSYFAMGQCQYFCIIPLNDDIISNFSSSGVVITEIE